MSKSGASAPPPVNAGALISQQGNADISSAEAQKGLNNVGVASPLGATWYTPTSFDPGTGYASTWEQTQQLGAPQQATFDAQTALAGGLAGLAGNVANIAAAPAQSGLDLLNQGINTWAGQLPTSPTSTAGLPPLVGSAQGGPIQSNVPTDFANQITQAQKAAYNTQAGFLDPQFAERRSDLNQQLADQGLSPGTAAYDRAQGDLGRESDLAYQQAQNAAVAAGNAQQQALFGESLGAGQFANQAQQQGFGQSLSNAALSNAANQQGFNQRIAQWAQPLQALQGEAGLGQGLISGAGAQLPSLGSLANFTWAGGLPGQSSGASTITPPNIAGIQGAANTGNLGAFSAGNTLNNQLLNGIGSLGGTLGGSNALFGSQGLSGALGLSPLTGLLGSFPQPVTDLLGATGSAGSGILGWLGNLFGAGAAAAV